MKAAGFAVMLSATQIWTLALGGEVAPAGGPPVPVLSEAQRDFMTWRFGMFVHFNLGTVAGIEWAGGYEDPALFHPDKLDCGQWADAAKAAGMTYLVLTVKHTEGIALYDSALTTHDITKFKNYRGGHGDIVREFVNACRARGLKVGLYYCFPGDYADAAHHNAPPPGQPNLHGLPPEAADDMAGFIKQQLAELLTNYAPVDLLWIDQYANPYTRAQWPEILAYVKALAPRCIVLANNAGDLQQSDALGFEFPWSKQLPPGGNVLPAEVCDTIQTGARWFWHEVRQPSDLQTAEEVVARLKLCHARHANYLLNVPPDPEGLISGPHLERLREIGALLRSGR
ncbi:MAG: alpha-L-fucosidase [Opitutaceae bacterium]|nr:alpha-L-fucosidase [Opitutaceae bacterium]